MDKKQMRIVGVICLIICAACIFVGIERYQANAGQVQALNTIGESGPFKGVMSDMKGMMGDVKMTPGIPTITKYAIFLGLISGIGGVVLLVKGRETS